MAKMTEQDRSDLLCEVRRILRSNEEIPTMESLGKEYGDVTRERIRQFLENNLTKKEIAKLKVNQGEKKSKVDELNRLRAKRLLEKLGNQPEIKFKTLAKLCDFLEIDKKTYDVISRADETFHRGCKKRLDRTNSESLKQKVISFLESARTEKRQFTVDDIVAATGAKDSASVEATCCRLPEFQEARIYFIDRRKGKLGSDSVRRKKRESCLLTERILFKAKEMITAGEWANPTIIAGEIGCKKEKVWNALYHHHHLTPEEKTRNRNNRLKKT